MPRLRAIDPRPPLAILALAATALALAVFAATPTSAGIIETAQLTIVKVTDPASDPQDFDFDLTGIGLPADLDLDTDAGNATLPSQQVFMLDAAQLGAKTITENAPAGWSLTAVDCTGTTVEMVVGSTVSITVLTGDVIVCTFTNTKHASLTIVKQTDPASIPRTSTST